MKRLKKIFLIITFLIFITQIYYELYFTAFIQTIVLLLLFYSSIINKVGRISRLLIFITFLLSYPIQVLVIASGNTTLSSFNNWKYNYFAFQDIQVALVIMVAAIFYWIIICAHNLLSFACNMQIKKNFELKNISFKYTKKILSYNLKNKTKINYNFYLWVLFSILGLIVIIHNNFGWAIWGLPPHQENIFRLLGITYYTREYIIPIIMIGLLININKITIFIKIIVLLFCTILPLISLSKVTLVIYFIVLFITLQRDSMLNKINNKLILKNIYVWIFLLAWAILVFYWQSIGRNQFINPGLPIRNQLFLMFNLEIFNYELFYSIFNLSSFFSIIERVLGFYGLASSLFYEDILNYDANFLFELGLIHEKDLTINTPKELVGLRQSGGYGISSLGKFIIFGKYMFVFFILIFLNFFFQILFIKITSEKLKIVLETILIILFLRFFIDGEFLMLIFYTLLLGSFLLFLNIFKKHKNYS
jgi:hypothetical protein